MILKVEYFNESIWNIVFHGEINWYIEVFDNWIRATGPPSRAMNTVRASTSFGEDVVGLMGFRKWDGGLGVDS